MTLRERFLAVMEYQPVDRVPNWELGIWGQTYERWLKEGATAEQIGGDWFSGIDAWGMDRREFVPVNMGMIPRFEAKVIEQTERYDIIQHSNGIITRALREGTARGTRASMDQYLRFPVETVQDLRELKKRYDPTEPSRYPQDWRRQIPAWRGREHVLILGV